LSKYKKYLNIYIALAVFAVIGGLFYFLYSSYITEKKQNNMRVFFDHHIKQLSKSIDDAKFSSMAISILLAQNESIQNCFLGQSREECVKNIENLTKTLGAASMYNNIKLHLYDKDLKSYVRSWDLNRYGDMSATSRYLIQESIRQNKSMVGIEAWYAGVHIRAVSNVMHEGKHVGSIEVLLNYDSLGNFYKKQGIDLFVLLDKNKMQRNSVPSDQILNDYYIENLSSANLNIVGILREIDLKKYEFYVYKTHYFCVVPLIDASNTQIGYYVLHVNTNEKERNISQNYFESEELF
jgi:hypothetical protein